MKEAGGGGTHSEENKVGHCIHLETLRDIRQALRLDLSRPSSVPVQLYRRQAREREGRRGATDREEQDAGPLARELLDHDVHLLARLGPIRSKVQNRHFGQICP